MEKSFTNYASMLGMTDKYTDEQLDALINQYEAERKKVYSQYQSDVGSVEFFTRNVNGLKRMKEKREEAKIAKEFTLKQDHINLLGIMYFSMNENNVLIGVLPENREINKALNITAFTQDGDYFEEDNKRVGRTIKELPYAIREIIKRSI